MDFRPLNDTERRSLIIKHAVDRHAADEKMRGYAARPV